MKRIYLSSPHMSGEELKLVTEAFETNWIAPLGPHVDAFEKEMADYLHVQHAAALSSGTSAIHLALILLGVEQNDEVICQSFTFSASANPIVYQNGIPIFVDSEPDSWNMDPELLEQAIKERIQSGKKPKAVIVVHLYGQPAKMDEINSICNRFEIPVIEDAAEALGSTYKKNKAGSLGDFSILSFNGNKIITTSGGGMLLSNNEQKIKKARFLATQARDEAPHYQHSHIGYNYRMSNVLAGIGRGQLKVIDTRVNQRRAIFTHYFNKLSKIEGIHFQPELEGSISNKWLTAITIDSKLSGISNNKLSMALSEKNIESRPVWKPMHIQPVFKDAPAYLNGVSESIFSQGLCLPSGSNMTPNDLERIFEVLDQLF